jgi:tetratricopeptide (TPR) repeat protein
LAINFPIPAKQPVGRLRQFWRNTLAEGPSDPVTFASVLAITFLCYIRTLSFEFVYDDEILIVNNPLILSPRSIPDYFTQHLIQFLNPYTPGIYYRPVQFLWLLLNRMLWGTNPVGWHLSVVTLHGLASGCVYLLARKILREKPAAWLAGAVFALHPVHVESAGWAMGFIDPLFTFLVLASFLCFLEAREFPARRSLWRAGSLFLYALAAFSKEPALVLPLLVFACTFIGELPAGERPEPLPLPPRLRSGLVAAAPYLAVTAVYLAARLAVLKSLSRVITSLPFETLVVTLPRVLWTYFKLLLWPVGLSAFYDVRYVQPSDAGPVLLQCAGLALVAAGLWRWARRSSAAAVATSLFLLPFLVLLNLRAFPKGEIVHDRYLYLASVGFALLVALAWRSMRAAPTLFLANRGTRAVVAGLLVAALGAGTIYYSGFWANNQTLYSRSITIAPNNDLATNNYAGLYVARGDYAGAIPLYARILARHSDFWLANYNLGYCFYKLGRLDEAEHSLQRAATLDASFPDPHLYLGLIRLQAGRVADAEADFRRALALRPNGRGYHFALGMALKSQGALAEARREFQLELANNPGEKSARDQIVEIDNRPPASHVPGPEK